ncbi:MAG: DEAD/DEAH box helicase [Candidatus Hodarchaeota archaeon]
MTVHNDRNRNLWTRYRSAIDDYQEFRDLEDILTEFRAIAASESPTPSVELLTEIANHFQKFKQVNDAKKTFGRILQLDSTHRETWKQLSSLYFKMKDVRKGEFCLQKYYTLTGGNACLQKATELRLASSGKLKKLPTHQELGLQDGLTIQTSAPKSVITLAEFHNRFDIPAKDLPTPIQKIVQFAQHQIVDYRLFERQLGEMGASIDILNEPNLVKALKTRKITHFFQFQEDAITTIQKGQDVCIVAPTGNGKTEAFLLPTLLKIREYKDCGVQLLLIYPMKALAKDQLRKIEDLAALLGLSVRVFDGDTSHYWRKKIYADPPEILVSNPDILHYHLGIGKNSSHFQDLLAGLKIVILDEIHSYTGTFGSNMYFILRRLERVVQSKLQFIGASATVANAQSFTSKLLDRPITVIECKNGRRGRLHFLIVAPFEGMSTLDSVTNLINSIKYSGKTLVFQDSHRNAEILYQKLGGTAKRVGIHRAGLDKKIREQVEADFRGNVLDLLVATPTLELGIDIGDLDTVVTPPIAVNRAMQRIGRAGRKGQEALAIIHLNSEDPISNYYYRYPKRYYQDIEEVFFDPDNPNVTEHQLLCASLDHPIDVSEFPEYATTLSKLIAENLLTHADKSILMPTQEGQEQAQRYSIRGRNHEVQIKIRCGKKIGKRTMPIAMLELYPGAFYYAGGTRYQVTSFYFNGIRGIAELIKPKSVWGHTYPLSSLKPEILTLYTYHHVYGLEVVSVETKVLQTVFGYALESPKGTSMNRLRDPLYYSSRSKGLLFRAPTLSTDIMGTDHTTFTAALHTLVHVLLHASLPFIGGQLSEIGGLALIPQGYILLFDQANGSGVCAMLLDHLPELFTRAYDILACECKDPQGCPKCTFLPRCSHNNTKLDKFGARSLLTYILEGIEIPLGNDYTQFAQTLH